MLVSNFIKIGLVIFASSHYVGLAILLCDGTHTKFSIILLVITDNYLFLFTNSTGTVRLIYLK